MHHFKSQLRNKVTGVAIAAAGGTVFVANAGLATKALLLTATGAALTNPITPTNGSLEFYTADTVASVDLYIQTPSGHFAVLKGVTPSGNGSIEVDVSKAHPIMVVPFAAADQTADATETDTGFNLLINSIVLPVASGLSVDVTALHAGKTIDFGTAEAIAETGGDADGMASALTTATAIVVLSAVATGVPVTTHVSITYTLSTGSTTNGGFLKIPVLLPALSL